MTFYPFNVDPKELTSDSLQGVLPEDVKDIFVMAAIVLRPKTNSLVGTLAGVEFGDAIRLDMKVSLKDAFKFISTTLVDKEKREIDGVILTLGEEVVTLSDSFCIRSAKIVEIDSANKICILAIDLFKVTS